MSCVASWTGSTAGKFATTGALAAEAISKSCEVGGVIVGLATEGGGFAAATVCLGADVTDVDAAIGAVVFGVFGAVKGLVQGVQECNGDDLENANTQLHQTLANGAPKVFTAPASADSQTSNCDACATPRTSRSRTEPTAYRLRSPTRRASATTGTTTGGRSTRTPTRASASRTSAKK